jgi:hypothetical protein
MGADLSKTLKRFRGIPGLKPRGNDGQRPSLNPKGSTNRTFGPVYLIYAIENNRVDIVKYLINESNVNPFYNNGEAMFIAVQYENIPMLHALFKDKLANKNTIVE